MLIYLLPTLLQTFEVDLFKVTDVSFDNVQKVILVFQDYLDFPVLVHYRLDSLKIVEDLNGSISNHSSRSIVVVALKEVLETVVGALDPKVIELTFYLVETLVLFFEVETVVLTKVEIFD